MLAHLTPLGNIWQLLKMNLRKKKIKSCQSVVSAMKRGWEWLPSELTIKLVHRINNQISEVVESHGDFILP